MKLSQKQAAFVENKRAGLNNRAAATAAGYTQASADTRGSELMRRPDIRAAIEAAGVTITKDTPSRMKPKYASSLDLLQHTYNNAAMPESVRMRAAEQALPYEHGRVGEKGKKEKAVDRALGLAAKRSKFTPKQAPQLRVVPHE